MPTIRVKTLSSYLNPYKEGMPTASSFFLYTPKGALCIFWGCVHAQEPYFWRMQFPWKKVITNKYLIASLVFVAYMIFADKNNVIEQYKLQQQYKKVKREHQYYQQQIMEARKRREELLSNDQKLEKFAREKYLMKKDNEDVFVIVPAQKDQAVKEEE